MIHAMEKLTALVWMRIFSALLLIALSLELFTSLVDDIEYFNLLIPFTYTYLFKAASINAISVLIVPLLINIALWIPSYVGYLFLRVALYIECFKFFCFMPLIIIVLPFSPFFQKNNPMHKFIILLVLIIAMKRMLTALKQEKYKKYFKADNKSDLELNRALLKMGIIFVLIVVTSNIVDNYLDRSMFIKYTPIETHELRHKELKYLAVNTTEGSNYIYRNKPADSVGDRAKLSLNKEMLLVRIRSQEDGGKDLFIFDVGSMKNTKILQTPIVEKGSRTLTGYTFTPDGKYIVVGDEVRKDSNIKFQVLNINTGERDNRFNDSPNLSKAVPYSKDIDTITFNQSGKYFAVVMKDDGIVEIWDYVQGYLVFTDTFSSSLDKFIWLTDAKFLVLFSKQQNIKQYELLEDDSVRISTQCNFATNIDVKRQIITEINSDAHGRYVAISILSKSAVLNNTSYIHIWDVQSEQKLYEISIAGIIKDIVFHPDGQRFIALYILPDQSIKVAIYNLGTGKLERDFHIKRFYNNTNELNPYKMEIIDNGSRVMIIEKAVHFISI